MSQEEMTPIKLLRILMQYENSPISDYEVVALVFQEIVGHREQAKNFQSVIIHTNDPGPTLSPYGGFEVK